MFKENVTFLQIHWASFFTELSDRNFSLSCILQCVTRVVLTSVTSMGHLTPSLSVNLRASHVCMDVRTADCATKHGCCLVSAPSCLVFCFPVWLLRPHPGPRTTYFSGTLACPLNSAFFLTPRLVDSSFLLRLAQESRFLRNGFSGVCFVAPHTFLCNTHEYRQLCQSALCGITQQILQSLQRSRSQGTTLKTSPVTHFKKVET